MPPLQHVDEADHDVDRGSAAGGLGADQAQLVLGPAGQEAKVRGCPVACLGLVERGGDHLGRSLRADPASHLARAFGPGRGVRVPFRPPGGAITSCGRRLAGPAW
jgi:hypothetical protein